MITLSPAPYVEGRIEVSRKFIKHKKGISHVTPAKSKHIKKEQLPSVQLLYP